MALTPEDVVNQKFTITKFRDGYDLDQVDDFLDTVVEEIRQRDAEKQELEAKIAELTAQLEERAAVAPADETIVVDAPVAAVAPEPVAPAPAADDSAQRPDAIKSSAMLQMALELHDKYVSEGETTRDDLINAAQTKSTQMVDDAERTARELVEEAQKRRTDELRAHSDEMERLNQVVAELRGFESEYRSTLRSYIQSQLRDLDSSPEPLVRPEGLE
ncbi:DivIVA domain-containing protein [Leucobacter komagatae]|uniref:Cell wall synthesis protein Wag31 n=1 Tax=Leucobacter komagatae TaxID=55969 RepID=A0A542Y2G8_9MICO|nr:DivIVA domain-containing protein [Leucobacter komagatae]TQL42270.1 DivIVA domain-containing protein [Leucobacter komagatae]